MKRWLLATAVAVSMLAATPGVSRASSDEEAPSHDARMDGYKEKVATDAGGTALTYICLGLMGVLCMGVLFINGKRTHLD